MRISIVMPAYNAERTISQAIHSVMDQTFQDWELIVVNDQSRDNTKNTILDLAKCDSRIRYIENEKNLGFQKHATEVFLWLWDSGLRFWIVMMHGRQTN